MKRVALGAIRWYQRTLSPDHGLFKKQWGGFCRFQPTCSQYTYEAIDKYGFWVGTFKGTWRIMRCNPWSKGGWDPVK